MPFDPLHYGPGWREFSGRIRFFRARGRCECTGECGRHRTLRCEEKHLEGARHARGKVRLTTAHLCPCSPPCQNPRHVKAMCQRCHLRTDIPRHIATRRAKQLAADAVRRSKGLLPPADPLPPPAP